jgi:hypothetical protein
MQRQKALTFCVLTLFFLCPSADGVSIDELSKTVVFLRQQSPVTYPQGDKEVPVFYLDPNTKKYEPLMKTICGTGLIVNYNKRDYIITAKHVAKELSPTAEVIMNRPAYKSRSVTFEWLSKQKIIRGARWFPHPKADIAVHPMAYAEQVELLAIDQNDCPKKDVEPPLLAPAYILGFPLGLGVHDTLSPVAKGTRIASRITSVDIRGVSPDLKFILLDEASAQGYSGSPVFYTEDIMSPKMRIAGQPVKQGEKVHFVGVVSATIPDSTGGKITLVVPISYVWDIFEGPNFRAYERALESGK